MIICRHMPSRRQDIPCDSCNRTPPFLLAYQITAETSRSKEEVIWLCEDCSNAVGRLHHRTMENGITHGYIKDEIMALEDTPRG